MDDNAVNTSNGKSAGYSLKYFEICLHLTIIIAALVLIVYYKLPSMQYRKDHLNDHNTDQHPLSNKTAESSGRLEVSQRSINNNANKINSSDSSNSEKRSYAAIKLSKELEIYKREINKLETEASKEASKLIQWVSHVQVCLNKSPIVSSNLEMNFPDLTTKENKNTLLSQLVNKGLDAYADSYVTTRYVNFGKLHKIANPNRHIGRCLKDDAMQLLNDLKQLLAKGEFRSNLMTSIRKREMELQYINECFSMDTRIRGRVPNTLINLDKELRECEAKKVEIKNLREQCSNNRETIDNMLVTYNINRNVIDFTEYMEERSYKKTTRMSKNLKPNFPKIKNTLNDCLLISVIQCLFRAESFNKKLMLFMNKLNNNVDWESNAKIEIKRTLRYVEACNMYFAKDVAEADLQKNVISGRLNGIKESLSELLTPSHVKDMRLYRYDRAGLFNMETMESLYGVNSILDSIFIGCDLVNYCERISIPDKIEGSLVLNELFYRKIIENYKGTIIDGIKGEGDYGSIEKELNDKYSNGFKLYRPTTKICLTASLIMRKQILDKLYGTIDETSFNIEASRGGIKKSLLDLVEIFKNPSDLCCSEIAYCQHCNTNVQTCIQLAISNCGGDSNIFILEDLLSAGTSATGQGTYFTDVRSGTESPSVRHLHKITKPAEDLLIMKLQRGEMNRNTKGEVIFKEKLGIQSYSYRLFGVISHILNNDDEGVTGGHYIAYILDKTTSQWVRADSDYHETMSGNEYYEYVILFDEDGQVLEQVKEKNRSRIIREEACVLFYQRENSNSLDDPPSEESLFEMLWQIKNNLDYGKCN